MLLNRVRQEILQDVLDAAGFDVPMVCGLACLAPYCFRSGDATALYLINASTDPAEDVVLSRLPAEPRAPFARRMRRSGPSRPGTWRTARRWALAWAAWKRP